jgi:hypothetical protein
MPSDPTRDEYQEVRREALLRALAIVQRYQDENWRRLRVNDVCSDIRRLLSEELVRHGGDAQKGSPASAFARRKRNSNRSHPAREGRSQASFLPGMQRQLSPAAEKPSLTPRVGGHESERLYRGCH